MSHTMIIELLSATCETLYMVFTSGLIAVLFGLPLGIILLVTRQQHILQHAYYNCLMSALTNIIRSIPFIILLVAVIPFTRLIVGTSIGTTAAIVPLSIAAIPFVARMVESALNEVANGLIEAGLAMGASAWQIIHKILIPESLPAIINSITITLINLIGYSAMAGAVGGGGLGDLAIRYGYQRFDISIMISTIIVLVLLVQLLQYLGDKFVKKVSH